MKHIVFCLCICLLICSFVGCSRQHLDEKPTETSVQAESIPTPSTPPTAVPETITETTAPPATETAATEPTYADGTTPLSEDEIATLTKLFTQQFSKDGKAPPKTNWYNMLIMCHFETPKDIDLYQLFGSGVGGSEPPEIGDTEFEFLKTQEKLHPSIDIFKIPKETVESVLQTYLGITLDEVSETGLDKLVYLEDTDCYYCNSSGTPCVDPFTITSGHHTADGKIVLLFDASLRKYQMTLIPVEGGYQIESNLWLNMDELQ